MPARAFLLGRPFETGEKGRKRRAEGVWDKPFEMTETERVSGTGWCQEQLMWYIPCPPNYLVLSFSTLFFLPTLLCLLFFIITFQSSSNFSAVCIHSAFQQTQCYGGRKYKGQGHGLRSPNAWANILVMLLASSFTLN